MRKQVLQTTKTAMAPHSSTLAWKIPWTEEPGGLQSTGSLRVGHTKCLQTQALLSDPAMHHTEGQTPVLDWCPLA